MQVREKFLPYALPLIGDEEINEIMQKCVDKTKIDQDNIKLQLENMMV